MSGLWDPAPVLRLVHADMASDGEVSARLDVAPATVMRWRHGRRMTATTAERVADQLGLHPSNVWGDGWWEAAL